MTDIRSGLATIHFALDNLAKNPRRLDIERSRFDREVSYNSHYSHNSTESLSPESPSTMYRRERLECRNREKLALMKAHNASRPDQQFDAQVYEMEAQIIKGIENRTLNVPDGTIMHILARDTVKKNWIEQGIWNEEWGKTPQLRWIHEASPEITPAPETDGGAKAPLSLFSSLQENAISTGKNTQQGGERQAKQKPGDEPSRPFHQFIYQISKERERIQRESPLFVSASPSINTKAYHYVKSIWVDRGIWDDQWGTLPGMVWKHESPLQIPDNDSDSSPSPTVPSEHVTNLQPRLPIFDWPVPAQADGPAQSDGPDQTDDPPQANGPAQADGPTSSGGERTTKRKRAAAPASPKKARRKVSGTVKSEPSTSRPAVDNSNTKSVLPDQGTQDTGRRRSKRIQNRNKSN